MESETQRIAALPAWEQEAEFNRFFIISMILIIVGCMGGIAVGMGGINAIWSLILIVVPTMVCLSLLLSVSPMRYIIFSAALSTIIDIFLLIYFAIV
jgi:hypothetical protein